MPTVYVVFDALCVRGLMSHWLLSLWLLAAPLHPGGMLDTRIVGRVEDFQRAGKMLVKFDGGKARPLVLARLGLTDIAPGLLGGDAICEWSGPMSAARLNHIARAPGVVGVEVFEIGSIT